MTSHGNSFLLTILFILLSVAPVNAQCLEGNCVNGSGVKLTRGHTYRGEFKDNHRHGYGLYEYPNGDKYEGQFVEGYIQGQGIYYFVNGDRYEGEFKDDKRNGVGTYYPAQGHVMRGVWENGVLTIPEQMVESDELPEDTVEIDDDLAPMTDEELDAAVNDILN